jgi:alkylhydroperoxidase family enzyme
MSTDSLPQPDTALLPDDPAVLKQRKEQIHDLTEAETAVLGGAENLVELPPERSEQLDWHPSTLLVVVHVRKKYARKVPLLERRWTAGGWRRPSSFSLCTPRPSAWCSPRT